MYLNVPYKCICKIRKCYLLQNESYCKISYETGNATLLCKTTALNSSNNLPFMAVPSLYNIYGKIVTIAKYSILVKEDPSMSQADEILPFPTNTNQTEIKFKVSKRHDYSFYMTIFKKKTAAKNEKKILAMEIMTIKTFQ